MSDYRQLFFSVKFDEYSIVENSVIPEYDITAAELKHTREKRKFRFDDEAYCMIMLTKLSKLNKYQRKEFIIHHSSLINNKKAWFLKLQDCIELAMTETSTSYAINPWPRILVGIPEIMDQIYKDVIETAKKGSSSKSEKKYNSFYYKQLNTAQEKISNLCSSLKFNNFISQDTTVPNFKQVFSNAEIKKPVAWTGNISELFYFIKLIHHDLQLVENLKQKQWEVTCQCFVDADGKPFERTKFRSQKKPKLTAHKIEKSVSNLK